MEEPVRKADNLLPIAVELKRLNETLNRLVRYMFPKEEEARRRAHIYENSLKGKD